MSDDVMYTKIQFGFELELEIRKQFDIEYLSRWAYAKYLEESSNLEEGLKEIIMSIVMMEEGPEFEYSEEELLTMSIDLQNKNI